MKKILLALFFIAFWDISKAQDYKFGVMSMSNLTAKSVGEIHISDSTVTILTSGKLLEYKFIKNANRLTYFTDGVMTHYFTMLSETGKKKGFEYDTIVFFHPDKNYLPDIITYWCKKEKEK